MLSKPELKVMWIYLRHANDDGIAWPGNPRLAKNTGMDERAIQRARQKLKERGLLKLLVKSGGYRASKWQLIVPETGVVETGVYPGNDNRNTPAIEDAIPRSQIPPNPGTAYPPNNHEQYIEHTNNSGGFTAGDGVFFESIDKRIKFLQHIGINPTKAVKEGLKEHHFSLGELKRMWQRVTNTHPAGKRQAFLANAIAEGNHLGIARNSGEEKAI